VNTKSSQSPYIFTNGPALETGEEESGSRFVRGARRSAACRREARFGLTQRENDSESGLMHYRARSYDPRLGRFLQNDPILGNRSAKHYVYARNNPLNHVDPLGLDDEEKKVLRGLSGG